MADQASQGKLSPWLRRKRIAEVTPYLSGRVLDFGCGQGNVADLVHVDCYLGFDPDPDVITSAREARPNHEFVTVAPTPEGRFDTVVCLAVIEHVHEPAEFLSMLGRHLAGAGRLVLTTPHPRFETAYTLGVKLGIFSHDAHEQHQDLLDESALRERAEAAGLTVLKYARFVFGGNQLMVLERAGRKLQ